MGYLAIRHPVFGSVAGGYSGLGSSLQAGIFDEQARAFVLPLFLPAGQQPDWGWLRGLDVCLHLLDTNPYRTAPKAKMPPVRHLLESYL